MSQGGQVRWFEWAKEPVPLVSYYPDSKKGPEVEVKIAKNRNGPVGTVLLLLFA